MAGQHDVTVRLPVIFDNAVEAAGWVERAIVNEMERCGLVGGCAVIVRCHDGELRMFRDGHGFSLPGEFVLPHSERDTREPV